MTVDEAIEEIEMLNWGGISFKTEQVQELIKQLQAEAESLKNCANCRHIIWGDGELLCSKNWVGNKMGKCLHWQANHAGRD